MLRGDALGILAARLVGADAVATPLNVSTALERSGWFARVLRTRIGSPYVIEGIERADAEGARSPSASRRTAASCSAGRPDADGRQLAPLPTRDAMAPILALLAAAARRGAQPVEPRRRPCRRGRRPATGWSRSRSADRARCSGARRDPRRARAAGAPAGEVGPSITRDGVRMTLGSGDIVHLRMSGNAPELRCYAEGETPARAEALAAVLGRAARSRDEHDRSRVAVCTYRRPEGLARLLAALPAGGEARAPT